MGEELGKTLMKCDLCGNTDVNEMVIFYAAIAINKEIGGDATTLPKFLYELMYPEKPRVEGAIRPLLIEPRQLVALRIRSIRCEKCLSEGRGEVEIKPTKRGM